MRSCVACGAELEPPECPADWTVLSVDAPISTWTATRYRGATSSTLAAASSPTGVISAAGCSASPP